MTLNFINSNLGKLIKTGAMTSLLLLTGCDSGSSIMGDGTEPMINYPGDSDLNITGQWRGRLAIAPNTPSSNYPGDESLDFALTFKQTGSGEEATLTAAMQFDFDSNASSNDNCLDFGDTNIELSMAYDSDGDGDVDSDDESYTHSGSASYTAQTATSPAAVRVSMNLHSGLQLDMDGTVSGSTISGSYSNWATLGTAVPVIPGSPSSQLESITVTSPGSGYTQSTTTVTITAPNVAGGVQATAVAIVTEGKITSIVITNDGSGYYVAPEITIDDPGTDGEEGATATAKLDGESGPITGCSAYAFTGSWSASR